MQQYLPNLPVASMKWKYIKRVIECMIVFDVATLGLFDCIADALGTKRKITQSERKKQQTLN